MWASIFTIAVAAAIGLATANLASEINKIQEARHSAVVQHSQPSAVSPSETDTSGSITGKTALDPGA
jgi:hypothetical protein